MSFGFFVGCGLFLAGVGVGWPAVGWFLARKYGAKGDAILNEVNKN